MTPRQTVLKAHPEAKITEVGDKYVVMSGAARLARVGSENFATTQEAWAEAELVIRREFPDIDKD